MKRVKFKTFKIILLSMVLGLGITVSANNGIDSKKEKELENKQSTVSISDNIVKEAKIDFKAGKVYELAFASIKGGEEMTLQNEYFAKIMPIAAKYGGKILGSFQVTAVTGGKMTPQTVIIFEWPTIASRDMLLADRKAKRLFPIRDAALTYGKVAYYTVDRDITVTFRSDKTYEFFNAWLSLDAEKGLPEYFKKSHLPKKRYGSPHSLVGLKPIRDAYVGKGGFYMHPHMAGIVEWNNTADYYGLIADPEFKKAKPYLDKSISRLDMIHTKFNFPQ